MNVELERGIRYKISVIMATNKLGGLDMTKAALDAQTFPKEDFEFVLVDEFYHFRKNMVPHAFERFNLKHIPGCGLDYVALPSSWNQGFLHCQGELVVCMNDYLYVPEDWLETLWGIYQEYGGKVMTTGGTYRYAPPPLQKDSNQMEFSAFQEPFTPSMLENLEVRAIYTKRDGALRQIREGLWECQDEQWWAGHSSDAAPLWAILMVNGGDVAYDGTPQAWDPDLGIRMYYGCALDFVLITREDFFTHRIEADGVPKANAKELRPHWSNHDIFHAKCTHIRQMAWREDLRNRKKPWYTRNWPSDNILIAKNPYNLLEEWARKWQAYSP